MHWGESREYITFMFSHKPGVSVQSECYFHSPVIHVLVLVCLSAEVGGIGQCRTLSIPKKHKILKL